MSNIPWILSTIQQGCPSAAEQRLSLVYEELRKLSAQKMAREAPGRTLQVTALIREVYLRLVDVDGAQHRSGRGHFFGAATETLGILRADAKRFCTHARAWLTS